MTFHQRREVASLSKNLSIYYDYSKSRKRARSDRLQSNSCSRGCIPTSVLRTEMPHWVRCTYGVARCSLTYPRLCAFVVCRDMRHYGPYPNQTVSVSVGPDTACLLGETIITLYSSTELSVNSASSPLNEIFPFSLLIIAILLSSASWLANQSFQNYYPAPFFCTSKHPRLQYLLEGSMLPPMPPCIHLFHPSYVGILCLIASLLCIIR